MIEQIQHPPALPARPVEGHKGLFGRVLVVGGSAQMIGAPVLAGTAALRLGAGLVRIALPAEVLAAAVAVTPELVGVARPNRAVERWLTTALEAADAVVFGPGLGTGGQQYRMLRTIAAGSKPAVIDADGLNVLAACGRLPEPFTVQAVLTPHPGEMARLAAMVGWNGAVPADEAGRMDIATRAAGVFGQVIVLKGHRTVVADGARVYVNRTGDSSLSKAGTGDVLSGMIGCLLAQKMQPFAAASLAVWLHGRAGELAGRALSRRCVLARDVIDHLPQAVREMEEASASAQGTTAGAPPG